MMRRRIGRRLMHGSIGFRVYWFFMGQSAVRGQMEQLGRTYRADRRVRSAPSRSFQAASPSLERRHSGKCDSSCSDVCYRWQLTFNGRLTVSDIHR